MKKLFIIILFSVIFFSVISQNKYNKLLIDPDTIGHISVDFLYDSSSNISYHVMSDRDSYNNRGIKITKINTTTGNIIKEISVTKDSSVIYESPNDGIIKSYDNKIIVITTHIEGSPNKEYISLTKFNTNLDTIWSRNYLYNNSKSRIAYDIIETSDSGFAICGSIDTLGTVNPFIIKTDSIGNIEWFETYGMSNRLDNFRNIVQAYDGSFILGGKVTGSTARDNWYLVRTDNQGGEIWTWYTGSNKNDYHGVLDLIKTRDSCFIAVGRNTFEDNIEILSDSRLLKFDINKNIIFDSLYSKPFFNTNYPDDSTNSYFTSIKENNKGNLLVIQYERPLAMSNSVKSNLLYLNPDGNLIWEREIRKASHGDAFEYIYDIAQTNDNGYFMSGYVQHNSVSYFYPPAQLIWIVKTDSLGCDGFGSCDTNLDIEFLNFKDTILDTDTFNLNFKISGGTTDSMYNVLLMIYKKDQFIENSYYENIELDSICNYEINYNKYSNLVGQDINEIYILYWYMHSDTMSGPFYYHSDRNYKIIFVEDNSILQNATNSFKIKVYPNPANSKFTVKGDNIKKIELYNIQGRLIYSNEIKKNSKTHLVSPGNTKKGVYFLKVWAEDYVVRRKVVLMRSGE